MTHFLSHISPTYWFFGIASILLSSLCIAFIADNIIYTLLLPAISFAAFGLFFYRSAFFVLLFCIPLSVELYIGNSLGIDFPTEPIMLLITFLGLIYAINNPKIVTKKWLNHTLVLLVFLHFIWIGITAALSNEPIISLKFFAAKGWYIISFFVVGGLFLRQQKDWKLFFWVIFIPLLGTVLYTIVRHALVDFSFEDVNDTMRPFYRNHVNYAVLLAVFLPFIFLARTWYKKQSIERLFLSISILIFLVGIFFSYTRASYFTVMIFPIVYIVIRMNWMKFALIASAIFFVGIIFYYVQDNRYVELAPNYDSTIYHANLNDHFSSTFQGEDLSTMERIHRWVAAGKMVQKYPVSGFGPGSFFHYYKSYTSSMFTTYVSDNEEKSTVHNYYMLIAIEQGFIGLFLFVCIAFVALLLGQSIVNSSIDQQRRNMAIACMISLCAILINNLTADLIEVDKIGSFYFLNLAILVNISLRLNKDEEILQEIQ